MRLCASPPYEGRLSATLLLHRRAERRIGQARHLVMAFTRSNRV
jgi:hypothetical protein